MMLRTLTTTSMRQSRVVLSVASASPAPRYQQQQQELVLSRRRLSTSRTSHSGGDMDIRFDGERIAVTGAGKGIGEGLCHMLHGLGAHVVGISRSEADLDDLVSKLPNFTPIVCDLANSVAAQRQLEQELPVHRLINNAGTASLQSFVETDLDDWDTVMNVNVKAVLAVSQVVARDMIARGEGGAIVNVSSQASMVGLRDHAAYCASKGALDQLTRVMATELGPEGIRVNCVNPTVVLTDMGIKAWSDPAKAGPMLAKIPLGKFAQ
eukprot:UC1_evm1s595